MAQLLTLLGSELTTLKEFMFCPATDLANAALQALNKVINLLCAGLVPPDVYSHLCSTILFISKKKGRGQYPISVRRSAVIDFHASPGLLGLQIPDSIAGRLCTIYNIFGL